MFYNLMIDWNVSKIVETGDIHMYEQSIIDEVSDQSCSQALSL